MYRTGFALLRYNEMLTSKPADQSRMSKESVTTTGDGLQEGRIYRVYVLQISGDICARLIACSNIYCNSLQEVVSSHHELGEGQQVSIGREALQLGEAMLDASVIGIDEPPVSEAIFGAVSSHPDPAVRKASSPKTHMAYAYAAHGIWEILQ